LTITPFEVYTCSIDRLTRMGEPALSQRIEAPRG
jgi:hypothetical protein